LWFTPEEEETARLLSEYPDYRRMLRDHHSPTEEKRLRNLRAVAERDDRDLHYWVQEHHRQLKERFL
jgi:hypothetical protein